MCRAYITVKPNFGMVQRSVACMALSHDIVWHMEHDGDLSRLILWEEQYMGGGGARHGTANNSGGRMVQLVTEADRGWWRCRIPQHHHTGSGS